MGEQGRKPAARPQLRTSLATSVPSTSREIAPQPAASIARAIRGRGAAHHVVGATRRTSISGAARSSMRRKRPFAYACASSSDARPHPSPDTQRSIDSRRMNGRWRDERESRGARSRISTREPLGRVAQNFAVVSSVADEADVRLQRGEHGAGGRPPDPRAVATSERWTRVVEDLVSSPLEQRRRSR